MSSVSTAFNVHYNQKLGDASGHLGVWGNEPWPLGGIDAPGLYDSQCAPVRHEVVKYRNCVIA